MRPVWSISAGAAVTSLMFPGVIIIAIGAADDMDERVELGSPGAARTVDRLIAASPFSPKSERCTLI